MLIIRTRHRSPAIERSNPIVAIFWSQGRLCQIVRSRADRYVWTWSLWVRLWAGHPWLERKRQLQRTMDGWVRRAPELKMLSISDRVVDVDGLWVHAVVHELQIRVNADYIRAPEQYWYREDVPQRDRKHYRLAVTYMESLCVHLCETLNSSP